MTLRGYYLQGWIKTLVKSVMLSMGYSVLLVPAAMAQEPEQRNVDPFEPFNRSMFALNDQLDRFIMRPLAKGYDFVMPAPAKRGVGNLFANLYDANAAINIKRQY